MNDSSKIKWLTGTTLLLILLNIVVVAFIWFAPHPQRPGMGGPGQDRSEIIIRELKLDDAQRKQFEQLRDEHHHLMMSISEKDRHNHEALFDLLKNGQDTSSVADSLISEIAINKKETERATYHHLERVREICTPAQQKKFDDIVISIFKNGPPIAPGRGRP